MNSWCDAPTKFAPAPSTTAEWGLACLHNVEKFIMRTRLPAIFLVLAPFGLAPFVATAQECQAPNLTQAQLDYLATQQVQLKVPVGQVPVIQRCDIDRNNVVDINDIRAISAARNQPAAHPDDPMDWNKDNMIDVLDARGCQRACTLPRCATPAEEPDELVGGVTETAQCVQSDDFDGDGTPDVVTLSENTTQEARGGDWSLEVVILTEQPGNQVQLATFPYSGKQVGGQVKQHLSKQPAGQVNLNPGKVTTTKPAIVSYQDGEPKVLYYYDADGNLARAFYGVDD